MRTKQIVLVALIGWLSAAPLSAQDKGAKELAKKLEAKVSLEQGIDPNTPLKDGLEFIAEKFGITIVVNTRAFENVGVQKVEEQPIKLKPIKEVALGKVLQMLFDQVEGTFKVEGDKVVVAPKPKK